MEALENKVVIVTGGSRGIGKAITQELLSQGACVVICSRKEEELKLAIQEIDPTGKHCKGIAADISSIKDCEKLVQFALQSFGRLDVLVNNAGVYGPMGLLEKNSLAEWHSAFQVNLFGAVNMSHAVLPIFKKQHSGKIINMAGAGIGGKRPLARFSSYYTAKGAIVSFTECIAAEVVEDNIQVNCIAPGAVNTALTDELLKQGVEKAGTVMYQQALAQKNSGGDSPVLAAKMIAFLASERSNHINGKMVSAKWNDISTLEKTKEFSPSMYTLRRIDDELFYEK